MMKKEAGSCQKSSRSRGCCISVVLMRAQVHTLLSASSVILHEDSRVGREGPNAIRWCVLATDGHDRVRVTSCGPQRDRAPAPGWGPGRHRITAPAHAAYIPFGLTLRLLRYRKRIDQPTEERTGAPAPGWVRGTASPASMRHARIDLIQRIENSIRAHSSTSSWLGPGYRISSSTPGAEANTCTSRHRNLQSCQSLMFRLLVFQYVFILRGSVR